MRAILIIVCLTALTSVPADTQRKGGGGGGGNRNVQTRVLGCCYNHGPSVAGVIAASVATAIVIGAIVSSLPPSCTTFVSNGIAYQNCGGTCYQPQYAGGNVQYVVVVHP